MFSSWSQADEWDQLLDLWKPNAMTEWGERNVFNCFAKHESKASYGLSAVRS